MRSGGETGSFHCEGSAALADRPARVGLHSPRALSQLLSRSSADALLSSTGGDNDAARMAALPNVPPGANPYDVYRKALEDSVFGTPTSGFAARLGVLFGLCG